MNTIKQSIFIIIALVIITAGIVIVIAGGYTNAPTPQVTEDSLTRGLVGYWAFEEGSGQTTADLSGNGNNGTLGADANPGTDDPKWTTAGSLPRDAVIGGRGVLSFDGSNDYIFVDDPGSNWIVDITDAITVALWIKPTISQGGNKRLIEKIYDTSWYFGIDTTDALEVYINSTQVAQTANNIYTVGEWNHVLFTYNKDAGGSDELKIYVNGQKKITGDYSTAIGVDNYDVYIGSYQGVSNYYTGLIDDVRIYNRALSPEEIRYLYNRGGPVSRWSFDEGSGSTAYDASSNSNDLTLTNMEAGDWQTGKSGSALSFDGANEYLTRAYDTDFDFSTNNFTLGGWFKHDTIATNPDYLITRFTGAGWKTYMDSDGDLCFGIDDDATWTPDDSACSTNQNYDDNNWHYFSAVRNTSSIELYIDGVKQAEDDSLDASGSLSGTSPVLRVGIDSDGSSNAWEGMLDEIVIYYYARDADSIKTDYNLGFAARFGPQTTCAEDPGSCMTEGLVGYWSFEEGSGQTTADLSGNGNTGTLGADSNPGADDPRWSTAEGLPRNAVISGSGALDFDGSDDYVGLPVDVLNADTRTISAWFYQHNNPASYTNIVGRARYLHYGIGLQVWNDSGTVYVYGIVANNDMGWANNLRTPISNNQWNFVVFTTDGYGANTTGKIYVNGELKTSYTGTANYYSYPSVEIGAMYEGSIRFFDGLISEVRIYNRALSAEEIRYLYNRGGPVLHYKFDEGSGTTAHDEIGDVDAAFPGASANQPSWSSP